MTKEIMSCPYCKFPLEINITWAIKNERYFCDSCCKSFPIRIGEVPEKDEKVKKALEEIEKEFNEEVDKNIASFDWSDF